MAADVHWKEFGPSTFEIAKRSDRPVLLVITKPWCPHSRALLERSFRDPEAARIADDLFVPVHVDAERRPDVNERYGTGAWPTIAYLTPDGELLSQDGFLEPEDLADRLRRAHEFYTSHRREIEVGLKSLWARKESGDAKRVEHGGRLNREIVEDVVQAIYEKFDHRFGGWGEGAKFPHPEAIDFGLIMVAKRDDPHMREVVRVTLDRMMKSALRDRIDGGMFRFSSTPDWRTPHHEKVLDANALALRNYLEAYQLFDAPAYREVAEGIVSWMVGFMLDSDTGAFFGNQEDDVEYLRARRRGPRQPGAAADRPHDLHQLELADGFGPAQGVGGAGRHDSP